MTTHAVGLNPEISTWARFQNAAADGVKWGTKVVSNITDSISGFVKSVVDYVRPFFAAIGRFFSERFAFAKDWLKDHKDTTVVVLVTLGLSAIAYSLFTTLCCGGVEEKPAEAPKTEAPAQKAQVEPKKEETPAQPTTTPAPADVASKTTTPETTTTPTTTPAATTTTTPSTTTTAAPTKS